jgi:hypothetical protein
MFTLRTSLFIVTLIFINGHTKAQRYVGGLSELFHSTNTSMIQIQKIFFCFLFFNSLPGLLQR